MALRLEIVTPERTVYSSTAESVVLPTLQGEIGVLPGHIPLVTLVKPGEIEVINPGNNEAITNPDDPGFGKPGPNLLAVDKGFAEILGDKVSILTEAAIDVEKIDLGEVEEAKRRAQEALEQAREEGLDPEEIERLEAVARFAIAQELAKARKR
ncbi:MAG: F0F1 ATP synthase subunit epsilon [Opitutales bacterium]